jgi:cobalt-zinc-cadmium efflux system outer membrane protein
MRSMQRMTERAHSRRDVRPDVRRAEHAPWLVLAAALASCTGTPTPSEEAARRNLADLGSRYRPGDARPELAPLTPQSTLAEILRYAMLRNPRVEAAYYEWAASVEAITTARSLPDPRLTFTADISDMLSSLMPGLMLDLPGPGKLRAAGDAAAAGSRATYFDFESEVLRTALAVKAAYFRLHFLEESLEVERETLRLLDELEQLAQQKNAAGLGSLQDAYRAQIERDQVETAIANLEDSRSALAAELKAALGLGPGDPDPPLPERYELSAEAPDAPRILADALSRNPALRRMEAELHQATALLDLANRAGVPDFSFGLEVDVKPSPWMLRPAASATLPIWRDKIAATIAAAQARKRAAEARLSAEQVAIAAELAILLFAYRESVRDSVLLETKLLPKGRSSLEAARSGYVGARADFLDVIDAQRQLLAFSLGLVEARTRRELALAALSLLVAGVPPAGTPVLGTAPNADSAASQSTEIPR